MQFFFSFFFLSAVTITVLVNMIQLETCGYLISLTFQNCVLSTSDTLQSKWILCLQTLLVQFSRGNSNSSLCNKGLRNDGEKF